jgi:hypothetical protein
MWFNDVNARSSRPDPTSELLRPLGWTTKAPTTAKTEFGVRQHHPCGPAGLRMGLARAERVRPQEILNNLEQKDRLRRQNQQLLQSNSEWECSEELLLSPHKLPLVPAFTVTGRGLKKKIARREMSEDVCPALLTWHVNSGSEGAEYQMKMLQILRKKGRRDALESNVWHVPNQTMCKGYRSCFLEDPSPHRLFVLHDQWRRWIRRVEFDVDMDFYHRRCTNTLKSSQTITYPCPMGLEMVAMNGVSTGNLRT